MAKECIKTACCQGRNRRWDIQGPGRIPALISVLNACFDQHDLLMRRSQDHVQRSARKITYFVILEDVVGRESEARKGPQIHINRPRSSDEHVCSMDARNLETYFVK